MDLALSFGVSDDWLRKTMTEPQLQRWARYAANPGMPFKRLEIYLAQIALMVARGPIQGAENMTVKDFLMSRADEEEDYEGDDIVNDARDAFGYAPNG